MSCFIAVVPPADYSQRIRQFAAGFGFRPGWPPHVTVKAQPGLAHDLGWLGSVRQVCSVHKAFPVTLGEPFMLGQGVLCLQVESPAISDLHRAILATINPSSDERARFFEGDLYVPHLTLAVSGERIDSSQLQAMRTRAAELGPFPSFLVKELVVFRTNCSGAYQPAAEIPLGAY